MKEGANALVISFDSVAYVNHKRISLGIIPINAL